MSSNKWVNKTKQIAEKTNKSFGQALQDKNHRISYPKQCNPSKMFRGANLLAHNHPAMTPPLPLLDHSFRTNEQVKAYKDACNKQKDNHINHCKYLRKK